MTEEFLSFDEFTLSFSQKSTEKEIVNNLQFQLLDEGSYIEFGGFGVVNFLHETFGSEHWVSENSDFFRFSESRQLAGVQLRVPLDVVDTPFNVKPTRMLLAFGLALKAGNPRVVRPIRKSVFDIDTKTIFCVDDEKVLMGEVEKINLCDDFFFIRVDGKYSGYGIRNPIANMGAARSSESTDSRDDFLLLKEFFILLSPHHWSVFGDDPELVVPEIINFINVKLKYIENDNLKVALADIVFGLRERFDLH